MNNEVGKSSHIHRMAAFAAFSFLTMAAVHADERSIPLSPEQSGGIEIESVDAPLQPAASMLTTPDAVANVPEDMSTNVDMLNQSNQAYQGAEAATTAAVADGVTTALALSAGAVEMNPLIATSPAGLLAMTGLKIGLVQFSETLPEEEKRTVMKTTSALWGGAAVNNLLVLLAAPPPISIVAGIVTGFVLWNQMEEEYEEADQALALQSGESTTLQDVAAESGLEEMEGIYVN